MKIFVPFALAATLALTACGDDPNEGSDAGEAPASTQDSSATRQTREAVDALRDAGRETGEAASAAAENLRDAAAPALERAREAGANALESAQEGLNDVTRGAACQTARAAEDAEGIAANC